MKNSFENVLNHLRSIAGTEVEKGRLFERLMKAYLTGDPLYQDRFSHVWLWSEWSAMRSDFSGGDTGVDLVAEERGGGFCAIQCKCYAPGTQIAKSHLDSFISASAREPFTARIVIDTGDEWGPNARKTIEPLKPACTVLRFGDLAERPVDWPDLATQDPEKLRGSARTVRLAAASARGARGCDGGVRSDGSRQAHHGVRYGQDVHGVAHRGRSRRRGKAGSVSGAVDIAAATVDAGMGGAVRGGAPLHRDLLRHAGGSQ